MVSKLIFFSQGIQYRRLYLSLLNTCVTRGTERSILQRFYSISFLLVKFISISLPLLNKDSKIDFKVQAQGEIAGLAENVSLDYTF